MAIGLWAGWSAATILVASMAASLPVSTRPGWGPDLMATAPPLARWDAGWYRGIALRGYSYSPQALQNTVGFYPLYPLLVRWISRTTGTPVFDAGIACSLAALLGGLILFADLVRERCGDDDVPYVLGSMLVFPAAFFFAAFYTESLFLFTTIAAVWAANRGRWILSGAAAAAACLTRFNGFLIAVPLVVYMLAHPRREDRARPISVVGALVVALAGILAFPLYLWRRWGDPLLYIHDKARGWPSFALGHPERFLAALISGVGKAAWHPGVGGKLVHGLELSGFLVAALSIWPLMRGRWRAEGLYVAATVLLLVFSGNVDGLHRYVVVLFPCFVPLGQFLRKHPVAAWTYWVAGTGVGVITMTRFIHWMFVG